MDYIGRAFSGGGIWMYLILIVFLIALTIIIERFVFIFFRYRTNAKEFMIKIQNLIVSNQTEKAVTLCDLAASTALARVLKAGITRLHEGQERMQKAMEEAILEILPSLTRGTENLITIASTATLLGLLGTIVGLVKTFYNLSAISDVNRYEVLTYGIAQAMNVTAFGLIVAIPCILGYLLLSNSTRKIVDELDLYAIKLENLSYSFESSKDKSSKKAD
jgi:biopolymer transport protein ExbB/TolQ